MESIKDILKELNLQKAEQGSEEGDEKNQQELFNTESYSKEKKNPFSDDKGKYISKEYQFYGLRLAGKLQDQKRMPMYIKWAKEKPRAILEQAFSFAIDYPNATDRSRLFMWKVKQLEKEYAQRREKEGRPLKKKKVVKKKRKSKDDTRTLF